MKLTDTTRLAIAAQLVTNALSDRRQQHQIDEHELALAIYAHTYKPKTREAMEKLPAGWLPVASYLQVRVQGESGGADCISLPAKRRVLAKHCSEKIVLQKDSELANRRNRLIAERESIQDEDRKLRLKIRKVLAPITTLKQLGECWPEALPVAMGVLEQIRRITPPEAQAPQHTPPAELNAALRLKPVSKPAPAAKKPTGKATRSAQQAA